MLRSIFVLIFFICNCLVSLAEPAPFGIEINRSTYEDVSNKYRGTNQGINKYSNGKMYNININQIDADGLKSLLTIFDEQDKLSVVIAKFEKRKYKTLADSLSKKYTLVTKSEPFVGDQIAKFKSGETKIEVLSLHMGSDTEIAYTFSDFEKRFINILRQEEENKKQKEENIL